MPDTTIKVDSSVRDRLAVLAAERGLTTRDLVAQLALDTLTQSELRQRHAAAMAYVVEHLVPDFDASDVEAGEVLWQDIKAQASAEAESKHPAA